MRRVYRTISILLLVALAMSMFSGAVYADRCQDAVKYLKSYLKNNGATFNSFGSEIYLYEDAAVHDGMNVTTGFGLEYLPDQDIIYAAGFMCGCNASLTLDYDGKKSECYLATPGPHEAVTIDHASVRADTRMHYSNLSEEQEPYREEYETSVTVSFHRALLLLNKILKTGGYNLADLGFTNYQPENGVCGYLEQCPGRHFKDMPAGGTWSHDSIDWAVENQITTGTSATQFSPDQNCTRGQIVTFLWRAMGCPAVSEMDNPFSDVQKNSYYYNAVLWAVENGITNGITDTSFAPDQTCTRAQVVTFLHRAAGMPETGAADSVFADVSDDSFYAGAVKWAVNEGITNGTGVKDGFACFSPNSGCTRAQVVTFLFRAYALDALD